jgi:protein SCO1/2
MAQGAPIDEAAAARRSTKRVLVRAGILVLIVAAIVGVGLFRRAHEVPPLGTFGHVPAFQLVDQNGAPFTDAAMTGHPTVVDFVFTRCTASCPRLTANMAEIQSRLASAKSEVRLVSFSVDPENDTPPVLKKYAEGAHADPARWSFVTGPAADVEHVVVSGFKVSAEKTQHGANDADVTHGNWLVLVDPRGEIRGYYTTDDALGIDKIVTDALRLESTRSRPAG